MGFHLDMWDWVTFATLAIIVAGFVLALIFIMELPGKIAIARKHPEAEAVRMMGWVGFVAIVPWIQAFIWAFKPTNVVDIRRFPREEAMATEKEIQRLSGKTVAAESPDPEKEKSGHHHRKKKEEDN
jgi:ABC-type antimicrobial peptide transport system permease subunit